MIRQRLFVALVIMALVTSMISGPMIRVLLGLKKPRRLATLLSSKLFSRNLVASTSREAITELARLAAVSLPLSAEGIEASAWRREMSLATGIGNGVALPHARLDTLAEPVVVVGISDAGIDFDSPDGEPAHVIFLILTPRQDAAAQLKLSAEIGTLFSKPRMLEKAMRTRNFAEFLGLVRSSGASALSGPH